jgi:hypothetical protein
MSELNQFHFIITGFYISDYLQLNKAWNVNKEKHWYIKIQGPKFLDFFTWQFFAQSYVYIQYQLVKLPPRILLYYEQ